MTSMRTISSNEKRSLRKDIPPLRGSLADARASQTGSVYGVLCAADFDDVHAYINEKKGAVVPTVIEPTAADTAICFIFVAPQPDRGECLALIRIAEKDEPELIYIDDSAPAAYVMYWAFACIHDLLGRQVDSITAHNVNGEETNRSLLNTGSTVCPANDTNSFDHDWRKQPLSNQLDCRGLATCCDDCGKAFCLSPHTQCCKTCEWGEDTLYLFLDRDNKIAIVTFRGEGTGDLAYSFPNDICFLNATPNGKGGRCCECATRAKVAELETVSEKKAKKLIDAKAVSDAQIKEMQDSKDARIKEMQDAKDAYETEKQEMQDSKDAYETEKQEMQDAKDAYETEKQEMQDAKDAYETEKQEMQDAKDAYETEKQEMQDAKDAYETKKQEMQDVTVALEIQEGQSQVELQKLREDVGITEIQCTLQCNVLNEQQANAEAGVQAQRVIIERLEHEKSTREKLARDLSQEAHEAEVDAQKKKRRFEQLQQQVKEDTESVTRLKEMAEKERIDVTMQMAEMRQAAATQVAEMQQTAVVLKRQSECLFECIETAVWQGVAATKCDVSGGDKLNALSTVCNATR